MKTMFHWLVFVSTVFYGNNLSAQAQEMQLFRISGPTATAILTLQPDGMLVWSNAQAGMTYTVQTASSLNDNANWSDYVQISAAAGVNTNLLVAFNPPAGMTLIPAGSFTMGDSLDGEADALPTVVYVSAFYMDINLVTYNEWQSVYVYATNNGYGFDNAGSGKALDHPAQMIDWYDAVKWCNARSQQAGLTPVYYTDAGMAQIYTNGQASPYVDWNANGYRLPTEAEWEKAARGGLREQRFPWGNTISENQANYYSTNSLNYDSGSGGFNSNFNIGVEPYTSPAEFFPANGYRLHDMAGNEFQWCWDWYGTAYPGGSNPVGPAIGSGRVLRGGYWGGNAVFVRCANRFFLAPAIALNAVSFRCVRRL